jgi:AcrR family transcriptional regulator
MRVLVSKSIGSRDKLIRAAAELFHERGVGATSAADIAGVAGIEPRSFYRHFKGKEGIFRAVLQWYFDAIEAGVAPVKCEFHSWPDVEQWFYTQLQAQQGFRTSRSCPLATMALGVTENDDLVRDDLDRISELVVNRLAGFLAQDPEAVCFAAEDDARETAYFCLPSLKVPHCLARSGRTPTSSNHRFRWLSRVSGIRAKQESSRNPGVCPPSCCKIGNGVEGFRSKTGRPSTKTQCFRANC